MAKRRGFRFEDIHSLLQSIFGEDLHAKRVYSLANATVGVMAGASLAIDAIGQGLAQARGKLYPACGEAGGPIALEYGRGSVGAFCTLGTLCGEAA